MPEEGPKNTRSILEKESLKKRQEHNEQYRQKKEQQFQEQVTSLEDRTGYVFTNKELLIQSLTGPSFATMFGTGMCASNKQLETEGDKIITEEVSKWLKVHGLSGSSFVDGFLRSNLYFSKRAIDLDFQLSVRIKEHQARAQTAEPKIRATANALEAFVGALERDGGRELCNAFIAKFILPDDPLTESILRMSNADSQTIQRVYSEITGGRGQLILNQLSHKEWIVSVIVDGQPAGSFKSFYPDFAAQQATVASLKENPSLLWGTGGDVSMLMPSAAPTHYGTPVVDQTHYRGLPQEIPTAWKK